MDDIGNYIYLVIIIVAALSSVFKKKKAQKPVNTPAPEADIKDVLRELLGEKPAQVNKPAPEVIKDEQPEVEVFQVKEEVGEPYERPVSYETIFDSSKLRIKKNIVKHHQEINSIYVDEGLSVEEEPATNLSFANIEDAKKAIIYTEIMNRKY